MSVDMNGKPIDASDMPERVTAGRDSLIAQRDAAIDRAEKAEALCGHAFVAGARWWQSTREGATPFPSETDEMEAEAAKRYPFAPHPIAVELDAMTARAARLAAAYKALCYVGGAQSVSEAIDVYKKHIVARAAVDAAGDLEGGAA